MKTRRKKAIEQAKQKQLLRDPMLLAERLLDVLDKQGYPTLNDSGFRNVYVNHFGTGSFEVENMTNGWNLRKRKAFPHE